MRRVVEGTRGSQRRVGHEITVRPHTLLLVLALLLCLCPAVVLGAEPRPGMLRLGYFPNITHAEALCGPASGDFERATGVHINWIAFNAGPSAIEAMFVDAIDATFIGPSPTINGYIKSDGEKFTVVAGSAIGGAGLVVRNDSGINTDRDFGG